jgi:GH15 family glucan-1,4-alpha-glucosidase
VNRIEDYALIGDCHSAALVGRDGAIDWGCFPRFDSPSVFAKVLDAARGGHFTVAPYGGGPSTSRAYMPDTNVLVTTFQTPSGVLELTDFMATSVHQHHTIVRRARCIGGSIDVEMTCAPRFEYGLFSPGFIQRGPYAAEIVGGADALDLRCSHPVERLPSAIIARWSLGEGEQAWMELTWRPGHSDAPQPIDPAALAERSSNALDDAVEFWRNWLTQCWYEGDHAEFVHRSALALKAMTYSPTGALVAAPTSSLPEFIGGPRNWDYRFTWIRDATLTLTSLFVLGFREEASAFKRWLERACAGRPQDLQIMYGIGGERALPERDLLHLSGHRDSAPVRVGNGAVMQLQLDSYGQILEAAWLYRKAGGELTHENWGFLAALADVVCMRWHLPDNGIWEIRDEPRHFTHSKLHCWIALDRAIRIAGMSGKTIPDHWTREREALRSYILNDCAPEGWLHQAAGYGVPDAATLLVPASGLISTMDPLSQRTIEVIRRQLEQDGLIYRYLTPDGLEGGEGAFLLCSFWLVDCLTFSGRLEEAEELLNKLIGMANDVGLFAEEVDVRSGEALGNFPQAFSHMALVLSCAHLEAGKQGLIPPGPHDYAEFALDHLVARAQAARRAV